MPLPWCCLPCFLLFSFPSFPLGPLPVPLPWPFLPLSPMPSCPLSKEGKQATAIRPSAFPPRPSLGRHRRWRALELGGPEEKLWLGLPQSVALKDWFKPRRRKRRERNLSLASLTSVKCYSDCAVESPLAGEGRRLAAAVLFPLSRLQPPKESRGIPCDAAGALLGIKVCGSTD